MNIATDKSTIEFNGVTYEVLHVHDAIHYTDVHTYVESACKLGFASLLHSVTWHGRTHYFKIYIIRHINKVKDL